MWSSHSKHLSRSIQSSTEFNINSLLLRLALFALFALAGCASGSPAVSDEVDMGPVVLVDALPSERDSTQYLTDAFIAVAPPTDDPAEPQTGEDPTPVEDDEPNPPMDPRAEPTAEEPSLPTLGLGEECDADEAMRYENFVLAQNCPGPCCWEYPGDQLHNDPKRMELIAPTIHSAYHDYPTVSLKSDVPPAEGGLRYYVPLAKYSLENHLEETPVACLSDADCSAVGGALTATCSRQDGDGDGQSYEEFRTTEYVPCVDGRDCVDNNGIAGDLATQSAVPASMVGAMCEDLRPADDAVCEPAMSICVYSPAWVSQPDRPLDNDGRAAPIIRPSGRLFIQGINLVDTDMKAYFVRVRAADRNGAPTNFTRMAADPVSGDVIVRLQNGAQCPFSENAEGDCSPMNSRNQRRLAVQPNTYTRGAGAAQTAEARDGIPPMHWYLERENQWLRYHRRVQDGEDVDYGFAELYDDLTIAEVPKNLAPGLYAVQMSYSANTWLSSLEQQFGRENACMARSVLRDKCLDAFENRRLAERQCANLVVDCEDPDAPLLLERDRSLLTNPIYVQIAPNQVEQTYRINVDGFRAIVSGEYGPGAYGDEDRLDIWVSDDVNFFSMIVRFDPTQLEDDTECGIGQGDDRPTNPVCSVSGPWVQYLHDVEPGRHYSLQDRGFSADVKVRPGEVINVVTFVFDTDGRGNDDELFAVLDGANDLLGGVARIVAGAYGADGIGNGIAGALNGVFGATNRLIAGLNDPELIAFSVTSYTAEELALLTLARQMGLSPNDIRNANLDALQEKPLFEMRFQNEDYDITETLRLGESTTWGRHTETRRFETRAPGAREFGCIREHLLNSCAYRGHSTYEIDYSIEHIRAE